MADLNRNLNASQPHTLVGDDELYAAKVDEQKRLYVNQASMEALYISDYLKNGSSPDMNVNGSGTPQNFNYNAASSTKFIDSITVYLSDDADFTEVGVGGIATSLTNGILLTYQSKGIAATLVNLQSNMDIISMFHYQVFSDVDTGILSTSRIYVATFKLEHRIALVPGNSDYFRATIRDNLSSLVRLRFRLRLWEPNP